MAGLRLKSKNRALQFLIVLSRYRRRYRRVICAATDGGSQSPPRSKFSLLNSWALATVCASFASFWATFFGGLSAIVLLNIVIQLVAVFIFVLPKIVSVLDFLKGSFWWPELSSSSAQPPPEEAEQKSQERSRKIRINVVGCAARAASIVMHDSDTIADLVRRSVQSELCQIEPVIYFPPHGSGPLEYSAILSSVGISEGSIVHARWRLRGGASSRSQTPEPEGPPGEHSTHSPALAFSGRTGRFEGRDARYFKRLENGNYECIVCPFQQTLQPKRVRRHEESKSHAHAIRRYEKSARSFLHEPGPSLASTSGEPHVLPNDVQGPLSQMLDEIWSAPPNYWDGSWVDSEAGTATGIDWESAGMDTQMQPSLGAQVMREMAEKTRQYLLNPEGIADNSDDEVDERSGSDSDDSDLGPVHTPETPHYISRSKRKVTDDTTLPFFPWPDRETCVLDILRHIPRSAFSRKHNETIHWAMLALGLSDLPSDRIMDDIDRALQDLCGIESLRYKGALGHIYYTNDFAGILAQEMANPNIRKHLHFYPEDAGNHLSEAWQAARWKDELDASLTTPMIRVHGQDFYTNEICLLREGACIPQRWFERGQSMFAHAWLAHPTDTGWVIDTSREHEVAAADLVLACSGLITTYDHQQLPDPRVIVGAQNSAGGISPWDRPVENAWRLRSNGHRVLALPLWLYCDDTSGNQSKKWNKHNSFLFTLAGLPRRLVHRESNIHFLSTSNIAPPLEMLDGIVNQLETCQKQGIWAWDCEANEKVLIIPSILAMLGDNPMQSEFACHIGLRGRKFCRMCHVEGDVEGAEGDDGAGVAVPGNAEHDSDASSAVSDASNTSNAISGGKAKKAKRSTKKSETMGEMVQRVKNFMKLDRPRTKAETQGVLRSHFKEACRVGGNAAFKRSKTLHGIKDTFQAVFLDRLFDISTKRNRTKEDKEKAMRDARKEFPLDITSPIWRIKDFDPHSDTPVEILHVILLGFVKYFWRDAIHRLKPHEKEKLISRLSSFDTSGLGVSSLSGSTLVTYAGSLTGRDFRVIAQVAPFVLYDLLEKDILDCWNAIGILVPLVWQPKIDDIGKHVKLMESAIDLFLDCACRVTPRWFNKPKFHIVLHLPKHVQRFGPAMLFATEGFESFNAIIRSASVHSNRHAPSREKSGPRRHQNIATWMERIKDPGLLRWHAVNPEALKLLNIQSFGDRILGLGGNDENEPFIGHCSERGSPVEWSKMTAAKDGFVLQIAPGTLVYTPAKTVVANGDLCHPRSWVIFTSARGISHIGQIIHSVQVVGSLEERSGRANFLIVAPAISTEKNDHYWMPQLELHSVQEWECIGAKDIKCTVNVQHNCAKHLCALANSRPIYQEREATGSFYLGVSHTVPGDLILNTAQMRDAIHILPFRPPIPSLNREIIVLQAAKLEIDERKKKQKKQADVDAVAATSAQSAGVPSGPSRGGGTSQRQRVLSRLLPQVRMPTQTTLPIHHPQSPIQSSLTMATSPSHGYYGYTPPLMPQIPPQIWPPFSYQQVLDPSQSSVTGTAHPHDPSAGYSHVYGYPPPPPQPQ